MGCDPPLCNPILYRSTFQSTHPHGVRQRAIMRLPLCMVSIHAPAWGATCGVPRLFPTSEFQSTHPHGVRQTFCRKLAYVVVFQSTHPHGVRPTSALLALVRSWFQSTHPHGVRPKADEKVSMKKRFQSTHPHGVRLAASLGCFRPASFNPRTRMGCDDTSYQIIVMPTCVSIHAPAWGATSEISLYVYPRKFQSTHPHGVRQTTFDVIQDVSAFQSTHPHGVRQGVQTMYSRIGCFNPRTRMGCDFRRTIGVGCRIGFNPRTRMGCDRCFNTSTTQIYCFNPRTRMGCDIW